MTDTADREELRRDGAAARGSRIQWSSVLERYGLMVIFAVVFIGFSLRTEHFGTITNVKIILGTQSVLAMVALAAIVPLITGKFDLSVGAIVGTSSIVAAAVMSRHDGGLAAAVIAALLVGAAIGVVNGILVGYVGVDSFIATLAMGTVLQGLVQWYSGGATISGNISETLISASSGYVWGVPKGFLWMLPAAVGLWYVLTQTPLGRHMASIGSNDRAAHLAGIRVKALTLASFVVGALLASVAGVLVTGQAGSANPETALGAMLLPAFAAAFLGRSAFTPGKFNVPGTLLAVYFVAFSVSGFQFLGADSWIQQVFSGCALAGAVTLSTVLGRRRGRS